MSKKIIIIFFLYFLTACTTTHYKGDGIILSEKKIHNQSYEGTTTGAIVGGAAGGISGAAVGGVFGFALGAFSGYESFGLIAMTVGAGALGALAVGAAGGILGGSAGYMVDAIHHPAAYQYIVQPSYQSEVITITQYATFPPIPVKSKVSILEKNQAIFIERK